MLWISAKGVSSIVRRKRLKLLHINLVNGRLAILVPNNQYLCALSIRTVSLHKAGHE